MGLDGFLLGLDLKGILLVLAVFLLMTDFVKNRTPLNYPPGPTALPVVGNFLSMDRKHPYVSFTKLAKTYGNVYSFRFGSDKFVFVCGYKMLKEALVTKGDKFVDRPPSSVAERFYTGPSGGLFMSNGEVWKRQRRFALSTLRTFGLGKSTMEQCIQQEIRYLQDEIQKNRGELFNPVSLFNNATANIICQLVMGRRFDYSDQKFQTLLRLISRVLQINGSIWAQLYESFPRLMKHVPGPHNELFKNFTIIHQFMNEEVERHKQNMDRTNPRDYIDAFLIEMEKNKESELGFTESNLAFCSMDLFLAGTDTTSTTLQWALLYLVKHQDVQEKVQAEIERAIGPSRLPSMSDRVNLPFTDAVVHEIQRMGNIIPLNGIRMAVEDTTLGGYHIPKGTALMAVLTSVMFDQSEWETPQQFNPGHFLDNEGKFVKREALLPFSAGKRVCLGEGLARMELFLFLVGLLQRFSFSVPEGVELSTEDVTGITRVPKPYRVQAKVR